LNIVYAEGKTGCESLSASLRQFLGQMDKARCLIVLSLVGLSQLIKKQRVKIRVSTVGTVNGKLRFIYVFSDAE